MTRIWRDGQKLFIDAPIPGSVGAVALHPTSETEFYPTHGAGYFQYTFLRDAQGAVNGLRARVQGVEFTSPRIDATAAEQLMAKLSERVQSQKPRARHESMANLAVSARQDRLGKPRLGSSKFCRIGTEASSHTGIFYLAETTAAMVSSV